MYNFFELQLDYLVPLAVAVPIGLLFIFFVLSRGGPAHTKEAKGHNRPLFPPVIAVPKQAMPAEPTFTGSSHAAFKSTEAMDIGSLVGAREMPGSADLDTVIDVTRVNAAKAILVVDDSAVPRVKLRKLFEAQGYRVETANDGIQALDAIARTRFSLIITDLEMPNMDGFELIAAVQGSLDTENIPLIAITGHEEMQARVHDIQGLYGIFKKPWNDRELLKRVDVLASLHS
jgi:CheY-like chemotaxis protein